MFHVLKLIHLIDLDGFGMLHFSSQTCPTPDAKESITDDKKATAKVAKVDLCLSQKSTRSTSRLWIWGCFSFE